MGVVKLSTAGILDYQKYSSFLAGNTAFYPSDYYLLETEILTTTTASVSFDVTGLGSTYQHLQLRMAARSTGAGADDQITMRFNSVTTSSYSWHRLLGNGSSVSSTGASSQSAPQLGAIPASSATANNFGGLVVDILDFASSSKNTTVRSLNGFASSWIALHSIAYLSTATITSVDITALNGSLAADTRLSIYGLKVN